MKEILETIDKLRGYKKCKSEIREVIEAHFGHCYNRDDTIINLMR
jgi:hypothetical protein